MGLFNDTCPSCGAAVRHGASFCPKCGKPAPRVTVACPGCGNEVRATSKFCTRCGAPIAAAADKPAAVDELNRWRRPADEFARRIEAADLRNLFQRGLVVEPGTRVLVFQGGKMAVDAGEGTYDLNRPLGQVNTAVPATAILVDAGQTRLSLAYRGLSSKEDVRVDVVVELVVRLADPAALFTNLMHGRDRLSLVDLALLVAPAGANVVQARVRQSAVADLDGNLAMKAALDSDLRSNLSPALASNGLELVALRFVEFSSPEYEPVRRKRAETFLAEQRTDDTQRRAALNRRIRETLTADRMNQFTTAKDFEEFVRQTEHELGMQEIVRREEMESLKADFEEKREDRQLARRHLLERLDLEHELAVLQLKHQVSDAEAEHMRKQQRDRQQADWELAQHQVRIDKLKHDAELGKERDHVQLVREKAEIGMALRKQKNLIDDEEETMRNTRELARKAEEIHLQESVKDQEARRRLEEREQQARHEVEKIRALSEVEQARLAADLKKTEVFKGMSEDQILALMAKDSPHVASAIAERARAQAQSQAATSTELKALYEKILLDKDSQRLSEAERLERVMNRAMQAVEHVAGAGTARQREEKEEIKAVMGEGMDRMADVAVAKAGAPGASRPQAAANVVCPSCQRQSPAGTKFCDNCGHKFFA
jgi:hypothetical protein